MSEVMDDEARKRELDEVWRRVEPAVSSLLAGISLAWPDRLDLQEFAAAQSFGKLLGFAADARKARQPLNAPRDVIALALLRHIGAALAARMAEGSDEPVENVCLPAICEHARWKAVARYRAKGGEAVSEFRLEELDELALLIERGPDWNALIDITITLARPTRVAVIGEDDEDESDGSERETRH